MRLFVGIPFPQNYQDRIIEIKKQGSELLRSRISWVKPGNMHMTLAFIGDVQEETVEAITDVLTRVGGSSFTYQAGGGGFFPFIQKPRVVWVDSKQGGSECISLAQEVKEILTFLCLKKEKARFVPHITVGRVKKLVDDPWDRVKAMLDALAWEEIVINRFTLWSSELTSQGPTYHPVETYSLS